MKKNILLATALAITALAGCTDDSFVGDQKLVEANGNGAISFNSGTPAITRAASDKTGSAAASDLNSNFVVFGYKTMSDDSKQTVFNNYQANYVTNSAYTSTTNSAGWEYVGYKNISANMTGNVGVTAFSALTGTDQANKNAVDQTIKYWDYSASNYKFFAYSLGAGETGSSTTWANASVMTNDPKDTYTLSGNKDQLATCYISELNTIVDPNSSTPTEVDLRFLSFLSKIRVGFFENIPGYSVKDLKFYVDDSNKSTGDAAADGLAATLYEATGSGTMPKGGTYTITFDANGKPIVTFSSTGAEYDASQGLGKLNGYADKEYKEAAGTVYLGRTSNTATYAYVSYTDADNNEPYSKVLPNATGTDLTLKCDYTLVSRDGNGETIEVVGATAKVPALYTQWKPNFAYTYLFKISDNTDGQVGEVTGLYPITLDAVVASEQDGAAEYITTVSEPSITTFGVNSSTGKYVSGGNEYAAGSDIYATFVDAGTVITPDLGTNVNVYLATTTDAAAYPITEASVAEALLEVSAIDKKITLENKNADGSTSFTAAPTTSVDGVPSEDGKWLSTAVPVAASSVTNASGYYTDLGCTVAASLTNGYLAAGTYYQKWTKALKLTGAVATTNNTALVVEYVKTAATYNTESSTYDSAPAFKLYSDSDGTTEVTWGNNSTTYYKRISVKTKGAYAYKVIRVN